MTLSPEPSPRCLGLEEWPEPDQQAWRHALHDGDLLEDSGLLADLRPISLAHYRSSYGRWLWHVTTMHPDALREEPAARITRERVDGYVELLRRCNAPLTVVDRMRGLKRVAHVIAPSADWRWLDRMVSKVSARARPIRDKRSRMRPPGRGVPGGTGPARDGGDRPIHQRYKTCSGVSGRASAGRGCIAGPSGKQSRDDGSRPPSATHRRHLDDELQRR